jgi:hypothetical protein
METKDTTESQANLRWPDFSSSLLIGFFIILALSLAMALLQLKFPGATGNP